MPKIHLWMEVKVVLEFSLMVDYSCCPRPEASCFFFIASKKECPQTAANVVELGGTILLCAFKLVVSHLGTKKAGVGCILHL